MQDVFAKLLYMLLASINRNCAGKREYISRLSTCSSSHFFISSSQVLSPYKQSDNVNKKQTYIASWIGAIEDAIMLNK